MCEHGRTSTGAPPQPPERGPMQPLPDGPAGGPASVRAICPLPLEEELDSRLDAILPAPGPPLHEAMRAAVLDGGKRLRPRLLLRVATACGLRDRDRGLAL